jgi:hypothetical protein
VAWLRGVDGAEGAVYEEYWKDAERSYGLLIEAASAGHEDALGGVSPTFVERFGTKESSLEGRHFMARHAAMSLDHRAASEQFQQVQRQKDESSAGQNEPHKPK